MKIVLLGYMGCGKTTIGKILSDRLNIDFIDLDQYISNNEMESIETIFSERGEIYFRKKEHQYLKKILLSTDSFVLSLGGGTPCYYNNMKLILQYEVKSFFLKTSIESLKQRLINQKDERPLLKIIENDVLEEFIAKHLFERNYFYTQASSTIVTNDKSIDAIVDELKSLL